MRIIIFLSVLALAACASQPSLEELEAQAMETGDWQAVERHEELARKRAGNSTPDCPNGKTKICIESGPNVDCKCGTTAIGGR